MINDELLRKHVASHIIIMQITTIQLTFNISLSTRCVIYERFSVFLFDLTLVQLF